jgi:hypothetical protein
MKLNYLALLGRMAITGGDYAGFNTEGDVRYRTADGVPYAQLFAEFDDTLTVWNEHKTSIANLFSYRVTEMVEKVPSIGTAKFQPASEFGVPNAARIGVDYYSLSYGYQDWDVALRYTWKFLRENVAANVRAEHNRILEAHARTEYEEVMKAIYDNRSRTTEIEGFEFNVYPLYNGSGPKPPDYNGTVFSSNHSHYLTSGNTLLDPSDVQSCISLLTEHGYGRRSGTTIVFLVNQAVIDVVSLWRKGTTYSNSQVALYDWIPAPSQPAQFTPAADGLLGTPPPDEWNGLIVSGSYGGALFVEEPLAPSGYLTAVASGGPASIDNLVGIREHSDPVWRGLRLMPGNQNNYPLIESFYQFGMGTGIRQRGGAVVMEISADADYTIPAEFEHEILG